MWKLLEHSEKSIVIVMFACVLGYQEFHNMAFFFTGILMLGLSIINMTFLISRIAFRVFKHIRIRNKDNL